MQARSWLWRGHQSWKAIFFPLLVSAIATLTLPLALSVRCSSSAQYQISHHVFVSLPIYWRIQTPKQQSGEILDTLLSNVPMLWSRMQELWLRNHQKGCQRWWNLLKLRILPQHFPTDPKTMKTKQLKLQWQKGCRSCSDKMKFLVQTRIPR